MATTRPLSPDAAPSPGAAPRPPDGPSPGAAPRPLDGPAPAAADRGALRLDLVSPLPPVRSGIADYTLDLLPGLAELADVRLIHLPGQEVAPEVAAAWPSAGVEAVGEAGGEEREEAGEEAGTAAGGRLPLYQMGNNRYHEAVYELALRHPGVLTLHDVVLHHLLLDVTLGRDDFFGYRERLARDHGWIGDATALAKRWGAWGDAPVFALPAHRTVLRRQRGILVHSAWAAALVREEDPEVRVRAVPMGIPLPPPADAAAGLALRQRLGLPADAPVVGSFGFQTPIKRTAQAIAALAAPALAHVHLLVVGEEAPGTGLLAAARRAGVADRVHLAGYLPFADLTAAIAAVDLCLNLRYPTAGETSASLLRVMAVGRPAIVSDYAQFSELPDAIAIKVPLAAGADPGPGRAAGASFDAEAAALAAVLAARLPPPAAGAAAAADARAALRAMGDAARDHVRRRHDPRLAAAAVVAACREWQFAPPLAAPLPPAGPPKPRGTRVAPPLLALPHATPQLAGPEPAPVPLPTSVAWGTLPGEIEVTGAELPWAEGERRRLEVVVRNSGVARWVAGSRGPGGVALVVKLIAGGRDLLADRPWMPLPRDLEPGEEARFAFDVRRPPGAAPPSAPGPAARPGSGPAPGSGANDRPGTAGSRGEVRRPISPQLIRLWIEPHLFGGVGLSRLGGPRWERDI